MKFENIPADIKSKSLKAILVKLESKNVDLNSTQHDYKRLILLNKHMENLFKKNFKDITGKK